MFRRWDGQKLKVLRLPSLNKKGEIEASILHGIIDMLKFNLQSLNKFQDLLVFVIVS